MDIPNQPVKSVLSSQVSTETTARLQTPVSDISALNLQAGKAYPAQVIQSQQSQNAPTSDAATPGPESKNQPSLPVLQKNEYLVRVNAKTVLISSEKILEIGQKLFLALDPKTTLEKPSLVAQLIGQDVKQKIPSGKLNLNTQLATSGLLNTTSASQASSSLTAGASINNPSAINQLLQALNLTLDKQIPLQDGFKYIAPLLSAQPLNNQHQIEPLLRQALQQNLLPALTQASEIMRPRTIDAPSLSLNSAGSTLKAALLNSGLFLEQGLSSQPEKLQAFKTLLEASQTQATQFTSKPQTSPDNTSRQNALSNSLNKIQQTIEKLMQTTNANQQAGSLPGLASSGQALSEAAASTQDLKASLLSIVSIANRLQAKELSAEALKSLFMLPSTEDYAISPFAFPLLQANKLQSTKNLFEKQEFTTGQLLKLLAGMIHRLQFNQLHSLLQSNSAAAADTGLQQSWFFELPVVNIQQQIQTFNFRIDKEAGQPHQQTEEDKKSLHWKLLLSFDLDQLGPIYIQVKLHENKASSILWANQPNTLKLLQAEAAHFKASLESIGLDVSDLRCEQGQPTQTQTKLDRHLVDTKA